MVQRIQRRMPAKRLKEPDCPERSGAYEGESSLARRTRRCTQRKPFPKKSSGILRKGNRLEAYRFIDEHRNLFGVRWLLRRFGIYPNAYRSLRICSSKILRQHKSIRNGQQISPIYFSKEVMSDTTVRLLICMIAALLQA